MHISKRDGIPAWKAWGIRLIAILLALIGGSIITVYYVAGFISAELDYLASLLMDFVRP